MLIATDVGRLVKISKKITLPEKAGERLATRKTAVSGRKRLRGGVKQRLLKRHCKAPLPKKDLLVRYPFMLRLFLSLLLPLSSSPINFQSATRH